MTIRCILSLVPAYFITIFLKEKTSRKDVPIQSGTSCSQDMLMPITPKCTILL